MDSQEILAGGTSTKVTLLSPSEYLSAGRVTDDGTNYHWYFELSEEQDPKEDISFSVLISGVNAAASDAFVGGAKQSYFTDNIRVFSNLSMAEDSTVAKTADGTIVIDSHVVADTVANASTLQFHIPKDTLENGKTYYLAFTANCTPGPMKSSNKLKEPVYYKFQTKEDGPVLTPVEGDITTSNGATFTPKVTITDKDGVETISKLSKNEATGRYIIEEPLNLEGQLKMEVVMVPTQGPKWSDLEGYICDSPELTDKVYSEWPRIEDTQMDSGAPGTFILKPTSLESEKTYYFVLDKSSASGRTEFGENVIFEFVTEGTPHQHVEEVIPAKEATCTEPGWTESIKCSVCGETIKEREIIPKLGHDAITLDGKTPSCTEEGLTGGKKCSRCGEVLTPQTVIPAWGHNEETIEGKAATCTNPGLTEGKKCSVCGEVLEAQKEIPALGHKEEVVKGKAATCTDKGLTDGKKCSVCGEVLEAQKDIPALGHKEEVVKGKGATCTEKGLTDGKKCSVCGEVLEAQKDIPALGHTEEVVKGKAATCTEKGLTDGKKCSVCGEVLEDQKDIPALGHEFKDGKCTVCGAEDPDYKPTPVEPDTKFTGLANEADKDGNWWYYTDGKIDKTHTGVDQNKYGWWRVENGKVNFKAQGIYQNQYGWWKTTDGEVTFKENSIYQNGFGWWKCKDSKVDFNAQSIYQNKYGWWKTTDGKVTFKENGLFSNQYGTWKVENSKVNFNYNGTYQGKTIKNGKVQ